MGSWASFGASLNDAFYFVIDKIVELQGFFLGQAMVIGRIVLLIAILSAALNYALTGQGLKENIIKISKATLFFLIVIFAYPNIIGAITSWTFDMAEKSVYPSVRSHFYKTQDRFYDFVNYDSGGRTHIKKTVSEVYETTDKTLLFYSESGFTETNTVQIKNNNSIYRFTYKTVAPAALLRVIFFLASQCFNFTDQGFLDNVKNVLIGIICGFFIIFTGAFALLEYCICFLEFMLVAAVGVILFPLSIWEGSKFMSEKFIGAIIGFFIKLLLCNVAIFLLIYGMVSLLHIMSETGFSGGVDQIIFIVFVCLLFFYICKSAPAIAQSLLTGTPNLSATGAISAAAGAVAAVAAVGGIAKSAAAATQKGAQAVTGSFISANTARQDAQEQGGGFGAQASAFFGSIGHDIRDSASASALGLTRNPGGQGGQSGQTAYGSFVEHHQSIAHSRQN